ncbi:hypothetical protein IEE_05494 [Bacillus cereus BAG5X1-1]|uniref:Uncharacterized protein n=1 Tax=Bacillus cereus BAG5X1-1 TaxID=1053189 RepID=J7WVQ3_BACCE|nr:hypothetical protein [Bacillus cereus]EJQ36018.1 hypothetical protein IEE_05494 [Bacillus cereus BAG5X1-1]
MNDVRDRINSILYDELRGYLKERNERIANELFRAILSACRLVQGGSTIGNACGLAGMGAVTTHYEAKELRPYVREVMKRAEPKIEIALKLGL